MEEIDIVTDESMQLRPSPLSKYFASGRPEIVSMIPAGVKTVLDVGCGRGSLGALLKEVVQGRKVYGIDIDLDNYNLSKQVLDYAFHADANTFELSVEKSFFDCIIMADVVEHVIDPVSLIKRYRPFLKKEGFFLFSIPNIRHRSAIWRILAHGWSYDNSGLFDRTHLRFYSRASMLEMIAAAGLSVRRILPYRGRKDQLLDLITFSVFEEFLSYQYFVQAKVVM